MRVYIYITIGFNQKVGRISPRIFLPAFLFKNLIMKNKLGLDSTFPYLP